MWHGDGGQISELAEDYFKLAHEAPDANVRVAYVKMAQLWLECAYQIEFTRASTFRQKRYARSIR